MAERPIRAVARPRDTDYLPPLATATTLGIQHVLAMFVGNVTPAIVVATAAGLGAGAADQAPMIYLIQMSMLFAGIATLLQTVGLGPIGARLPILQGTSFAFVPLMVPLVAGQGLAALPALFGGVLAGGLFQALLGTIIGRVRFLLPPLVTGLVVLTIGLALVRVGIQYAGGGLAMADDPDYGSLRGWMVAAIVIVVTLGLSVWGRGMLSTAALLLGLVVGYLVALPLGMVSFAAVGEAASFAVPNPFHFGIAFTAPAVIGFCLMNFVSAVETVGDVSAITKGGADREATSKEIAGATYADGFGSALAGLFGSLPNTSFSFNVGLISMTGVMSRHVVTIGALFLILGGLVPKVGALVASIPIAVLGGSVIVAFGMVCAAGIAMLSEVDWTRRNRLIVAVSLSMGLGLQLEPAVLQQLPETARILLTTGVLPTAVLAIVLNLILPASRS